MFPFLLHFLGLATASYVCAIRLARHPADRLLATFGLSWGNLVVTSLLLSELHRLGTDAWFLRTSLGLAVMLALLVHRLLPAPEPAAEPRVPADQHSRLLVIAITALLAPVTIASIRIAATYLPNNYDSLTYHLPRAMIYMGQQKLWHFYTGNDRQIYFPFNFNLLQLWAMLYGPPLQVLNFLNLATWGVCGVAVHRLARIAGATANSSLLAAALALTSTQILAQATATTNDLPTASVLLVALVYVLRWRSTRRRRDALVAGLAAGVGAGSKLTVIFFAPAGGLILLGLAWRAWRRGALQGFARGAKAWIAPLALAAALAAPFAVINVLAKGQWQTKQYDYTLNRPFRAESAVQTTEAYLAQTFLEPLHRFTDDPKFTETLNTWAKRTLFPHWNPAHAFSEFYLFPPDLNEDHVFFGFAGPFFILCALLSLARWRRVPTEVFWYALLGAGWFLTYCLLDRWSLYNQRYFVACLLVLSPCAAICIDEGLASANWRRQFRDLLIVLLACAAWSDGVYLLHNTSRPFAPLWRHEPVPRALPLLPALLTQRMAEQPFVNFNSTNDNERAFLLMTHRRHQRFVASPKVLGDQYNVFSEWGFPRKVAYTNIEQRSAFTIVPFPSKPTAGVEFLGTIGSNLLSADYYGLLPNPSSVASSGQNRNVLVQVYYKNREPDRYKDLGVKVAGLNPQDHARLVLGVDYVDGSHETLATLEATGEARASVTRPFRGFTATLLDSPTGAQVGFIEIPYLFRSVPSDIETPDDPQKLFADELIALPCPHFVEFKGLEMAEGPYPQWKLPLFRWSKAPVVHLEVPEADQLRRLDLTFDVCLYARESADLDVLLNGELVHSVHLQGSTSWARVSLPLKPGPGRNVIELRNVKVDPEPDWKQYLEDNPDVKGYLQAKGVPLEAGARDHYRQFGIHENRKVVVRHHPETIANPAQLYYLFRTLQIEGYRTP